jgi:pantothenate kinase type III
MHQLTAALPQLHIVSDKTNATNPLGETTKSAMWNGAYWGVINEINGYIEHYSQKYKNLKTILTGGLFNIEIIDKSNIKASDSSLIFEPMLVPKGLNFIANNSY